jgi:nitroreductase
MKSIKAADLQPISLPAPRFEGGQTVFEALKARRTCREMRPDPIPVQALGDILWAAQGINRQSGPFGGLGRTAGSASNSQEICIYVARAEGVYLYEPEAHRLTPVAAGDHRRLAIGAGQSRRSGNAPVRLIYVVDKEKFKSAGFQEPGLYDAEVQKSYYFVDTGLIAQNVYLAAAALGLAAWFHNCNKPAAANALGLGPNQLALFGQTIGFPGD